jgi:hypothetical protein
MNMGASKYSHVRASPQDILAHCLASLYRVAMSFLSSRPLVDLW